MKRTLTREERRRRNSLRDVAFIAVCVVLLVGAAMLAESLMPTPVKDSGVTPSVTAYALEVAE